MSESKIERESMNPNYATHQDIQVLENKFSVALTDGFNKLEQAINTRTDKIEERVTTLDNQRAREIAILRDKQSNTGKFNPFLTISIVSLIWAMLLAGITAFGAVMLRSAVNEESLKHSLIWVDDTKEWIESNELRDNVQDVDIQGLKTHQIDTDDTLRDVENRLRELEMKEIYLPKRIYHP